MRQVGTQRCPPRGTPALPPFACEYVLGGGMTPSPKLSDYCLSLPFWFCLCSYVADTRVRWSLICFVTQRNSYFFLKDTERVATYVPDLPERGMSVSSSVGAHAKRLYTKQNKTDAIGAPLSVSAHTRRPSVRLYMLSLGFHHTVHYT